MLLKKIRWSIKRHPFLYLTRFRLLSKNSNETAIRDISYNSWNEKADIPSCFFDINSEVFADGKPASELEQVKQLVSWLCAHSSVGPGLSEPSDKALQTLVYGKGGVCSDIAQVFNNFCVINDISVREWGTTSAPFNRANGGHSFNEVFIEALDKWILIDPSWGMLFYGASDIPLSVTELYRHLREKKPVTYISFVPDKKISEKLVLKNYLHEDITPFLICGYRNNIYDAYLKRLRPYLPVFVIHFMVYSLGKSYHYKFPLDDYRNIFS